MKYIMLLFTLFAPFTLSAETTAPPQKEVESEALKKWEEKNAPREVKEDSSFSELMTKTLLLLIAILAALFVATWCMKKMNRFKLKTQEEPSRIALIEKKVLSPKSILYIIEIDGHAIALAESATNGVQLLQPLPFQDKKS